MKPTVHRYNFFLISFFIWLFFALTTGCGYHLRATGQPVGSDISSIAIPLIKSTSSSLAFETNLTKIIREEFISHARIPVVPCKEAEAVLIVKADEIRTEPLTYSLAKTDVNGHIATYETTNTRRLKIKLSAKLINRTTGKVIWEERSMNEKAVFPIGTDPLTNRYNQQQALQSIAKDLAKKIFSKTMERF